MHWFVGFGCNLLLLPLWRLHAFLVKSSAAPAIALASAASVFNGCIVLLLLRLIRLRLPSWWFVVCCICSAASAFVVASFAAFFLLAFGSAASAG
jgi:hypothetical protein